MNLSLYTLYNFENFENRFGVFQTWPEDALLAVATRFLGEIELSDKEKTVCIDMCQMFHISTQELSEEYYTRLSRRNYVTPTSYLEMINTFKTFLQKKRR